MDNPVYIHSTPLNSTEEFNIFSTELKKISDFEYEILCLRKKNDKHPIFLYVSLEKSDDDLISFLPLDLHPDLREKIFEKLKNAVAPGKYLIKKATIKYSANSIFTANLITLKKADVNISLPLIKKITLR